MFLLPCNKHIHRHDIGGKIMGTKFLPVFLALENENIYMYLHKETLEGYKRRQCKWLTIVGVWDEEKGMNSDFSVESIYIIFYFKQVDILSGLKINK